MKYIIKERVVYIQKHIVEADSKEDAHLKYVEEHCACDCFQCPNCKNEEFSHSMEVDIERDITEIN